MEALIKRLRESRVRIWEEEKKLYDTAALEGRDLGAEELATYERLSQEFEETTQRIAELEALELRKKDLDGQRERFEHVVKPEEPRGWAEHDLEERVRMFCRGGLPDAEWSPRAIEFKIPGELKRTIHEQRDLSKASGAVGGFTVPTGFVARLYEHLVEAAAVRQTGASIITTDSGENLLVPKTATHGSGALVAEAAAIPESDPSFGQVTLNSYKYGVMIQVSRELIEDSGVDLLDYLARQAGRALGIASGAHFVTGTGTGQPEGVQTNSTVGAQAPVGNTTSAHADTLISVFHSIVSGYRNRGVWFMLDANVAKVRQLKDTTNQYLWQPGLQLGVPDLFLGRPVVTDPAMVVMAASAKSILFGDFSSYYVIRDVSGLRFERSDDFAFANDLVSFRALIRTDGKPIDATAVKAYQNSAT